MKFDQLLRSLASRERVRTFRVLCIAISASVLIVGGSVGAAEEVDFNRDIRSILSNNCFQCHGPDAAKRQAGLRLDTKRGATAESDSGYAIVPGEPDESLLVERVLSDDESDAMPPADSGKKLTAAERELLARWVREGAPYAKHWSYEKPVRPAVPAVENGAWPDNEIDSFLLARMEREGLRPLPEAGRHTLIRRVSLDLTGLPPTVEEVERFVNDPDPQAYEKLVAQLLEQPAYGEHWARLWLDLARYADSAGYADDPPRTIWAFRDTVIRAVNENKPFDQITREFIAGDLLPDPTLEQQILTAFHRNTLTNNEGGTNDEEFRNAAIVDRVNTTMAVWMGTTINCCQCHTHKYDPITQEEFYQLFAILNQTQDADRRDESPVVKLWSPEQKRQRAAWEHEIAQLEKKLANASGDKGELKPQREKLAGLKKQLAGLKPQTSVPVMQERPFDQYRETHVQIRGSFLNLGQQVTAGVPQVLHPLAKTDGPPNRLHLAEWLVDAENPLTARVAVNRYWGELFGTGIVRTTEEFGSQGEAPSHPQVLDWLAVEFMESGWDVKHLLTLMVTSAAYRQSSKVTPESYERDPDNRLLARGPRFQLTAEMVRDQALAVSGLLCEKMYGPPVRPPQPSRGLKAAFGGGTDWKTSAGEDRYRRALYTTWRRSNPYPSMAEFGAPNREVCTLRRPRTNTPLQPLVTMNDPVYVEAAQALARRMDRTEGDVVNKARHGFRRCLARLPSDEELEIFATLYEKAHAKFLLDREAATELATQPIGPPPPGADVTELAAWTVVATAMLNLDEMFLKR